MNKTEKRDPIKTLVFWITGIGVFVILIFLLVKPFNDWSFRTDATLFGNFGDFIGGFVGTLFSLVAIFLLNETLQAQKDSIAKQDTAITEQKNSLELQREALENEKKFVQIEQFENRFFGLLSAQREITNTLFAQFRSIDNNFRPYTYSANGRDVFAYSKTQLKILSLSFNGRYMFKYDEADAQIYSHEVEMELTNLAPSKHDKYIKGKKEIVKIMLANDLYNISEDDWKEISMMPMEDRLVKIYGIYFQKYHYVLGHYFRHLFHIIKFVDEFVENNSSLNINSKKYIDFIQSQMNSFELTIFFYNALAFPKTFDLVIKHNFLENLTIEDLIEESHNCKSEIKLKRRRDLLDVL